MKKPIKKGVFFMKILDTIALILVIVGAVNWGLIGFFQFDLVAALFGTMTMFSRVVYALVGLAGLYSLSFFAKGSMTTDKI
ncbi:Hypothetical Uncharacterized protein [Clostridium chauvoei JF4335]|nr:Hypothetical Uncharacterized protein [Clostridium chauvoei JF4335]